MLGHALVRHRKRVLLYAQHLSGVGHLVRSREIARVLADRHDVFFVDGGRPVPRRRTADPFERIRVPRILRGPNGLAPLDRSRSLADVMRARAETLRNAVARIAPDVLLVEHYPFSKWELETEIGALVEEARRANGEVRLICSVRDALPKTSHEPVTTDAYERRVVATLNADFDAVFVHSDPTFTRLEDHFGGAKHVEVPIVHTGFVSEKPEPGNELVEFGPVQDGAGFVMASAGGGAGSFELISEVARAWSRLTASGGGAKRTLLIFSGLFWSHAEIAALREQTGSGPFQVRPFSSDFLGWMQAADLSISRAGYNTCMNVLETGTRALLLPNPRMSDQVFRARRLAEEGLAAFVPPEQVSLDVLVDRIEATLHRELPEPRFDLDGAERTREWIEELG